MDKPYRHESDATTLAAGTAANRGSALEVLRVFLKLGVSCFGGIGYFREEFVVHRKWIDEHAYADLVGLCQSLPGLASSQVGFSIGLMRAGYAGAFAAWIGFTLPSALLLILFAYGAGALGGPAGVGLLHGLKLVAVAIVAQAIWGMQAVPGPLFTFSAYLGTVANIAPHGFAGAALGLIGIFLPGILILLGPLPFRDSFRKRPNAQAMMRGVSAAVDGLLGAALCNPVWTSAVKTLGDFGIALVGFVLLTMWRAPPLLVVGMSAFGGSGLAIVK